MAFHFTANWFGTFAVTLIAARVIGRLIHTAAYVLLAAIIMCWWRPHLGIVQQWPGKAIAGM